MDGDSAAMREEGCDCCFEGLCVGFRGAPAMAERCVGRGFGNGVGMYWRDDVGMVNSVCAEIEESSWMFKYGIVGVFAFFMGYSTIPHPTLQSRFTIF